MEGFVRREVEGLGFMMYIQSQSELPVDEFCKWYCVKVRGLGKWSLKTKTAPTIRIGCCAGEKGVGELPFEDSIVREIAVGNWPTYFFYNNHFY